MNDPIEPPIEERVLVLAPTAEDAALTRTLLAEARLGCSVCPDLAALCRELGRGAGVLLLTEEVLTNGKAAGLVDRLGRQPPWSDVPILLLAGSGADSAAAAWAMDLLGNVTVLERPVRVTTLVSGLRAAIRARRRQYELRRRMGAMRAQSERLRLLWEAASVLLSTDRPDAMMRGLFAKIAPRLGLDAYFNFMVEDTGAALRIESCLGIPDEEARRIARLDFGQAICGTVAAHRRPITAGHIQQSDDPKAQLAKGFGFRAYACNPLMAGDRLLGTLSFASRSRDEFEAEELEFLETVCHYVAHAYERVRLIGRLREEDRKKDEFLATLAHELRNPLAPIRHALHLMKQPGEDEGHGFEAERSMAERQVRHMARLIDDLMDISRISRGKIELRREPLELGELVRRAVESARPAIEERGHSLAVSLPERAIMIQADPTRLEQILGNLLSNAAKYTEPGGRIDLAVDRDGGEVVCRVRDSGIGIDPELLPRVFDLFVQAEAGSVRSQGGLGIGLCLVKSLVELHGGSIAAHSEGLGTGSEFVVRLPAPRSARPAEPPDARPPRPEGPPLLPPRRLLIVDDNVDAAVVLGKILARGYGQQVEVAHDGRSALERIRGFGPEVVLLDLGLPDLDGYQVARRLRRDPGGERILLVALTGWGQPEDRRRTREAGFDHHLVKPVDPDELIDLLRGLSPRTTSADR